MLAKPDSLNLAILILLAAPVCFCGSRLLPPRLSPFSRRVAIGFLAVQLSAFALFACIRLASQPGEPSPWLGPVEGFSSLLATTQLALIGGVALITAILARDQPAWQRLYLLGLALVFPYIGLDDYFDWKALWHIRGLEKPFVLLGLTMAAATVIAAMRSRGSARFWHLCLLTGLAIAGVGGFALDGFPAICGGLGFVQLDGCLTFRFTEEVFEFLGFWLVLAAVLGHFTAAAPTPSRSARLALYSLPAIAFVFFVSHTLLPMLTSGSSTAVPPQSEFGDRAIMDDSPLLPRPDAAPSTGARIVFWSSELIYPFLFLLYVTVGSVSFHWLMPRLTRWSARLASLFFAAQVVTLAMAFGIERETAFELWLWDMGQEYNIPSLLASTQMALVGIAAIFAAWCAAPRKASLRLYLAAVGLIFIILARDEYLVIHENIPHWERYYTALGIAMAAAALILASRSPRRRRVWLVGFLVGLAMSAIGILFHDMPRQICGGGILPLRGCLWTYNYEEPLELAGIWLALLAMLGVFSDVAPRPGRRITVALCVLPALWIILLTHAALIPRLELHFGTARTALHFAAGVELSGYRVEQRKDAVTLDLYSSADHRTYRFWGYSATLIDQVSGRAIAKKDEKTDHQTGWLFAPGQRHIYRQRIKVDIPPDAAHNRAMWVALSAWRAVGGGYVSQDIVSGNLPRLSGKQVALDEFVLKASAPAADIVPLARFDNGFALQSVELPDAVHAGGTMPIQFTWRSDIDNAQDYAQFLHLGHAESGEWFVYDQPPLGDRLPTRLWYTGLVDSETWHVPLPVEIAPGQYSVFTGLYRAEDKERLRLTDASGHVPPDARIALGSLIIER